MDKSSLLKIDFYKLYDLYDKTTDIKEKKLIKEVVDEKNIINDDPLFQGYPDHRNNDFNKIIYQKKEFYLNQLFLDTTEIEDICNSEFSIKSHQSFLKNFMTKESPYKSILIYHGVGVGKTCSGLTIAENFRDPLGRKEKRILILCSKNIQIGWKKTIYDPSRGTNQCTGDNFINSGANTDREINKLVKQYYEIMAYQSFSNFVKRMVNKYIQRLPESEREQGKIDCIRGYFSNRYMVIDEVHNIRDEQGSDMRDAVKTIEQVIKYSDNLRLVLLTATPMYNRVNEILWILNMMLLNDKRSTINKKDVFDKNNYLTKEGESIIKDKCIGYISYLRGENPITFPIRLYPRQLKLFPKYSNNLRSKNSIINKMNSPSENLVGGKIKDKLEFLELFGSKLQGLQLNIYNKSIQSLIDKNPELDLDERGEKNPILDNIMISQITDMVYPLDKDDGEIDEYYGERGLKNCMNKMGTKYGYKKKILDKYGPIFDKSILPNHSCKMSSIIEAIDESEGIVFIYTNYIDSGIVPLQLALEQNGYKKHTGEPALKYPDWNSSSDNIKTKREPISYNGIRKSKVDDRFIQAKYMVIDGSTSKKILQHQLKIINSNENMNGEKIKIVIGTVVASEGLDFKRIRSVHILDPWLHLNRIEQTVGRAIRFCSHASLNKMNRNVLIYLHVSTLSKRETIDTSIYRYAEKKSIQIGRVENILKMNAVDRYLYKDVNVIKKGDIQLIKMKPCLYKSNEISIDPSDKSYSKVCSYSKNCNFNKDLKHLDIKLLNDDTFFDIYSSNLITNLKKKISLLYKLNYIYDLDSILGLLHEYGFFQGDMIFSALNEMIIHKFRIYDKYGNSGYLINSDNYYIYQPLLLEDESIPLYYRMNLIHSPLKYITLDKLNEIKDECECNKIYSISSIELIYNKLIEMPDKYQNNIDYPDIYSVLDLVKNIYTDLSINHLVITGYLFDRLLFEEKCRLIYGYLHNIEFSKYEFYKNVNLILESFIIYKSTNSDEYYFNNELKGELKNKKVERFGFVLGYNNKPCYYEYYNGELLKCNQVQIVSINKSLKRYITSSHYKQFKLSTKTWGYTIMRTKKFKKECVLKIVQPNVKGKVEATKYPPGPGNVCIENNIASRIENLFELISDNYSEIIPLLDDEIINNKKNICFLLEIILRYSKNNSFYCYDKIWLKYL